MDIFRLYQSDKNIFQSIRFDKSLAISKGSRKIKVISQNKEYHFSVTQVINGLIKLQKERRISTRDLKSYVSKIKRIDEKSLGFMQGRTKGKPNLSPFKKMLWKLRQFFGKHLSQKKKDEFYKIADKKEVNSSKKKGKSEREVANKELKGKKQKEHEKSSDIKISLTEKKDSISEKTEKEEVKKKEEKKPKKVKKQEIKRAKKEEAKKGKENELKKAKIEKLVEINKPDLAGEPVVTGETEVIELPDETKTLLSFQKEANADLDRLLEDFYQTLEVTLTPFDENSETAQEIIIAGEAFIQKVNSLKNPDPDAAENYFQKYEAYLNEFHEKADRAQEKGKELNTFQSKINEDLNRFIKRLKNDLLPEYLKNASNSEKAKQLLQEAADASIAEIEKLKNRGVLDSEFEKKKKEIVDNFHAKAKQIVAPEKD